MTELFTQPPKGDVFPAGEKVGRLLLIWVVELREGIVTQFGETDAVMVNIVELDGDEAGKKYENALLFPRGLVGSLKTKVGDPKPALGRLARGAAKAGQSAPYQLMPHTAPEAALAVKYLQAHPHPFGDEPPFSSPVTQETAAGVDGMTAAQMQALERAF